MKPLKLIAITFLLLFTSMAQTQQTTDAFEGPTPIKLRNPKYPTSALQSATEGWVSINFMINTDGQVFEPTIIGSSGPDIFHRAALRTLNSSTWQPASINGRSVEGSSSYIFTFSMDGGERVGRSFRRRHDNLVELINSGAQEEAMELLNTLNERETRNNYESALLYLDNYTYLKKFNGSDEDQIFYIKRALMFERYDKSYIGNGGFLPEDIKTFLRKNLFILEVNARRYEEALSTYYKLRESGTNTESFDDTVIEIHKLKTDSSSYVVNGKTDSYGQWRFSLFKPNLYIDNLGSTINEFRLLCRNKFQFFAFQEGTQYQIPESWGDCHMTVLGDADVDFEIIQFGNNE